MKNLQGFIDVKGYDLDDPSCFNCFVQTIDTIAVDKQMFVYYSQISKSFRVLEKDIGLLRNDAYAKYVADTFKEYYH